MKKTSSQRIASFHLDSFFFSEIPKPINANPIKKATSINQILRRAIPTPAAENAKITQIANKNFEN